MIKTKPFYYFLLTGLFTAILFSTNLYLMYFDYTNIYINTLSGFLAIYFLLIINRKSLFYAGFFVGILWFYWMSLSFIYYDLTYLIPLVILGLAFGYGIIFLCTAIVDNTYIRGLLLFAISYLSPFSFNWMKPEIIFVDTFFDITKLSYALIIFSLIIATKFKTYLKLLVLPVLFFALNTKDNRFQHSSLKIFLPEVNIKQENKWKKENLSNIVALNNRLIKNAILHNYDLVVLPETAYPLILNKNEELLNFLKNKSKDIDIITGSLFQKDNRYFNSTFHFSKEKLSIANKVVLVPFGEAVPLPEKIAQFINDVFYNGAQDYLTASEPTTFTIKNQDFRNAICYEATTDKIFENLNGAKYMVVTSNNAWFTPSIEPTLQKLLLKYYAKKYKIVIYHSINGSNNYTILPNY